MNTMNIALVGNPNVGKSTLFNALTGLRQHTGNWPGKTVETAVGVYQYHGTTYRVQDLPGLYSLRARSEEERLAAEVIADGSMDCTVVVCDATCLARSLSLALSLMPLASRMIVCLNLCDEAHARGIATDSRKLSALLGVPVVETAAGRHEGLELLRQTIRDTCDGFLCAAPVCAVEATVMQTASRAQMLAHQVQTVTRGKSPWRSRLDALLLSRTLGIPAAAVLLLFVLWLTIWGANVPSALLARGFGLVGGVLRRLLSGLPPLLSGLLLDGIYDTLTRVISVMLPPMVIFFPLFTLLEDLGLLPRIAFLLDRPFERCGACGKQALTSCMALGCNAVGVTGCRIIDSPRERLIAIVCCAFLPCNGRFPTLIVLVSMLLRGTDALCALLVAACLLLSILMVLAVSALLSRTVLRGSASGFIMELPPLRKPQLIPVLVRSLLDRTVFILGRALTVAAPAGAVLWSLTHIHLGDITAAQAFSAALEPVGRFLGMNGAILLAFLLGFPANELVLPVLIMLLSQRTGLADLTAAGINLLGGQLSAVNAVCMLLFCLFHWPCGTTALTIRRETGSLRWMLAAMALPTVIGAFLCLLVRLFAQIIL